MAGQTGRCECGAVAYEADSISATASFCHCSQCRRTSGHYWSAVMAPLDGFRLTQDRAAINRFGFNNDGAEAIADVS